MSSLADQYLSEVSIRKRNLETKQQIQAAENKKEHEMLMLWESSLEKIKEKSDEKKA